MHRLALTDLLSEASCLGTGAFRNAMRLSYTVNSDGACVSFMARRELGEGQEGGTGGGGAGGRGRWSRTHDHVIAQLKLKTYAPTDLLQVRDGKQ